MEPRRRNPLRRYPTAVCISVLHSGLTQSKTRALNSPAFEVATAGRRNRSRRRAGRSIQGLWPSIGPAQNPPHASRDQHSGPRWAMRIQHARQTRCGALPGGAGAYPPSCRRHLGARKQAVAGTAPASGR
jgi:hypothetical protein